MHGRDDINGREDESYVDIALEYWLFATNPPSATLQVFNKLAGSLKRNHQDLWLSDFLRFRQTGSANTLLSQAIQANHSGKADAALLSAARAEKAYRNLGNPAGMLFSRFEKVYALRRKSNVSECLHLAPQVAELSSRLHYSWIEIQTTIEQGSCEGMRGKSDAAMRLAAAAIDKSSLAGYQTLLLRALGLRGNLDMVEGRSNASWINNEIGLEKFWEGAFPDERGFQLYYNLQVSAEKNNAIYLALTLQRETLAMIAGTSRLDFEAMAHFRMAGAAQAVGDLATAQREMILYKEILSRLSPSQSRDLYEAYCEVGLARLALQSRSGDAQQHLVKATAAVSKTDNAMLRLEYLKAWADLDRLSRNVGQEQRHLEEIVSIGTTGFESLKSVTDRWRWKSVVEQASRRMLEIELFSGHSLRHTLLAWELQRLLESSPSLPPLRADLVAHAETQLRKQVSRLHDATVAAFAVLPGSVVVWVVDDRGIQEFRLPVDPHQLADEVRRFYYLCSDPRSSLEKVNASGSRLYEWLLAPIEAALAPKRAIAIEPDSFLSLVPWSALRTRNNDYLGNKRPILISTGLLSGPDRTVQKVPVKNVVVAIPTSLRLNGQDFLQVVAADEEAAELLRLYPGAKELRGRSVTIANIVAELPRADIFEFAGHAITREHGGELVVQGKTGAEIMPASSLSTLRLKNTGLVVLSACSTAAEHDADRDPDGLVRAFLNVGAGHVLASRWDVDSRSTASVMKYFYRSTHAGGSEAKALQAARNTLSTQEEFRHPYFWAGMEIFGLN